MTLVDGYLTVLARLTPGQIVDLAPLLRAAGANDPNVKEALREPCQFQFSDVEDGAMDMHLMRWFSQQRLPYLWEWEACGDLGAGQDFYDAELNHIFQFRIHEQMRVVTLGEAADHDRMEYLLDGVERLQAVQKHLKEMEATK